MSIAILCIAILIGICAWGFLLAGAVSFYDPEKLSMRDYGMVLFIIDIFISAGLFTMLYIIATNWRRNPEARHYFYIGASCLAVALALGFVSLNIS